MMTESLFDRCCLPGEKVELVDAIDDAVLWHLAPGDSGEGGRLIHFMDDFVTDGARRNVSRPAHEQRYSQ